MTHNPNTGLDLEDLEAIRHRADNATPGPWGVETEDSGLMILNRGTCQPVAFIGSSGDVTAETDAGFVASAREDVPALLAEVWRLADRVHELEIEVGNAHGSEATTAAHRDQLQEQVDRLTRNLQQIRNPTTPEKIRAALPVATASHLAAAAGLLHGVITVWGDTLRPPVVEALQEILTRVDAARGENTWEVIDRLAAARAARKQEQEARDE